MEIQPIRSKYTDESHQYTKGSKIYDRIPFTHLAYGASNTGKSTLIANTILKDFDKLVSFFTPRHIFIFAKNGKHDDNFAAIIDKFNKMTKPVE